MAEDQWGQPPAQAQPSAPAQRSSALLWGIIGALVVAIIVVALVFFGRNDEQPAAEVAPAGTSISKSPSSSPSTVTETVTQAPAEPELDPCDPQIIAGAGLMDGAFRPTECAANWMDGGIPQTDAHGIYQWDGSQWVAYPKAGTTFTGFNCYERDAMRQLGAPEGIVQRAIQCKANAVAAPQQLGRQAARPQCDGRNILIVESVIVHPGENADALIGDALSRHPGAQFTQPGHCSSLRAAAEGGEVYPVYFDYGRDQAAMCKQRANIGGNGRTLNTNADFTDPCI